MQVTIEAGTLAFSREDRTVTGLLLPYGEVGRTTLGRFSIPRGVVSIPTDPAVVTLNDTHDHTEPIGRATSLEDTADGVLATFAVARTPEGDAYLADVEAGRKTSLSAEVKHLAIRSGKAIRGALFGAAACVAGAFPSATLLAADAGPDDEIEVDGVRYRRVPDQTAEGDQPSDDAAPAAESEAPVAETETAPEAETEDDKNVLHASMPESLRRNANGKGSKGQTLYASLKGKTMEQAVDEMKSVGLFALDQLIPADVQPSVQTQWLGEIYGSKTYTRKFASLVQHQDLQGLKGIGWKFTTGKVPAVAPYAGFPAQPNSNEVKTESVTLDASRIAGAGAVDRAFIDFPTPEFWAGYFREQSNSYERTLDAIARDFYIANATAVTADTVPSGVSAAASMIVDGAAAILDAERDMPAWAIVGTGLWKGLLRTRSDDALAYLTAALGLDEGSLEGFRIVPSSVSTMVGKVLVGTRTAATVFELPGSPIRVDTVAIANGSAERGVFGYHAELANDPLGLALVAPGT